MKEFPILYKYTSKGQVQQWQIFHDNDHFWTVEGIQDGTLTTSLPTYCVGKNVGKKNETTAAQQAEREAAAKFKKKVDSGYNEVLTAEKKFVEPMLAHTLDLKDYPEEESKKRCKNRPNLFTVRTFIQPKMDGIRCINENDALMSRNGKPIRTCPHLVQNEVMLDGELYNHQFRDNFGAITSLCGSNKKPTKENVEEASRLVEFWAYDMPTHKGVFSERYKALSAWLKLHPNPKMKLVPTFEVFSEEDIQKYHDQFLEQGFEGSIIRLDLGEYENKRSKQLLKYKDFIDSEFIIKGVVEGEGGRAGTIGKFIMDYPDGEGSKEFKSNVKGDFDYLKHIWKHKKEYIGKKATIKYFGLTPLKDDGTGSVPRFPYVIKIDRDSYE